MKIKIIKYIPLPFSPAAGVLYCRALWNKQKIKKKKQKKIKLKLNSNKSVKEKLTRSYTKITHIKVIKSKPKSPKSTYMMVWKEWINQNKSLNETNENNNFTPTDPYFASKNSTLVTCNIVAQDARRDDAPVRAKQCLQVRLQHVLRQTRHVQVRTLDCFRARASKRYLVVESNKNRR